MSELPFSPCAVAVCLLLAGAIPADAQSRDVGISHLRRQGTATQLIVDGAPFLVLGGELGNSSASSLTYLRALSAKTSGTWETVFGRGLHTDELFMAWYFARYTEHVARAGNTEYPLPMS